MNEEVMEWNMLPWTWMRPSTSPREFLATQRYLPTSDDWNEWMVSTIFTLNDSRISVSLYLLPFLLMCPPESLSFDIE